MELNYPVVLASITLKGESNKNKYTFEKDRKNVFYFLLAYM